MDKKSKRGQTTPTTVQVFANMVEMRFKPQTEKHTNPTGKAKPGSPRQSNQYYDPLSMVLMSNRKQQKLQQRRLKFVVNLSNEHFLVGNENQLDLIGYGVIAHNFVDTDYYWSLSLPTPIQNVVVDVKHNMFLILTQNKIIFYQYNLKNRPPPPTVIVEYPIKPGVRFIRFLRQVLLGLFYNNHYQIYNIQNLPILKKKAQKTLSINPECRLLTIPPGIDNIINIFFEQPKQNKQSFVLWCIQLVFQGQTALPQPPYRVYTIMNYARERLSVQSYTRDIIFMNLGNQIMTIKNGYLIDTVNVTQDEAGSGILRYIHPNTILHITPKVVQVYNFSIDMSVKPQKIVLKNVDAIELVNVPSGAFFISVLQCFQHQIAVFYEDTLKKHIQSKGQISYYFYLSRHTLLKQKINMLFESIASGTASPQMVDQKYTVAKKMGLTQKEICIQIWNRSTKCTIEDYQYILATRDYKIIKAEIQKKLKKQSMVLREILRIEQGCIEINRDKIQSIQCTQQDLQDYTTSHFLRKKLLLFKDIAVVQKFSTIAINQEGGGQGDVKMSLKMDIQQYYRYKDVQIKSLLVEEIKDMLFNFKDNARTIRMIIKHFKFNYRIIYSKLLQEIVTATKNQLVNLLNQIPQLLPYVHRDLNPAEISDKLYNEIWGKISDQQWSHNLYAQKLETLHNKPVLKDFVNSIWFKKYWLTSHDTLSYSKKEIQAINVDNNSQKIFYSFISYIYDVHKTNNKPYYYQAVQFLQEKYQFFPQHLKGKCLLYENLYIYYYNEEKNNASTRLSFAAFLELDDQHLFKYFFDHEKIKKNCLLREIKHIYEQSDVNGAHIFNIGLFSYFYSSLSAISDLKYILNRINNQKTQFHDKNYGIYEVLVRSMQLKLRLGGPDDIPIEEVLIYIRNIPIGRYSKVTQQLAVMQNIEQQAPRFIQMKINMSIKEIMQNHEEVLNRIISYQITKRKIKSKTTWDDFRSQTFNLLDTVNSIRVKLYPSSINELTLLFFASNILESEYMISQIALLLIDEQTHEKFHVQEQTIENIVLYMYKWKFSQNALFIDNAQYLKKLFQLLPHENTCRVFLQSNLELALLLSSKQDPLEYPLSQTSVCPTIQDLKLFFRFTSNKFILSLNLQTLYKFVNNLQKIAYKGTTQQKQMITLHKIYQIVIASLLEKGLYRQVIDYIYKIIQIASPIKHINILYVILFIYKLAAEFNEESRKIIFRLTALLFYDAKKLLEIIQKLIKSKLTGLQQSRLLRQAIQIQGKGKLNFNPQNVIFHHQFKEHKDTPQAIQLIQNFRSYLKSRIVQVQSAHQYDLIFTILCNQPYLLVKFIDLESQHLNFKTLRGFLIMLSHRQLFSPSRSYQIFKRIFGGLVISAQDQKQLNGLLALMMSYNVQQEYTLPKFSKISRKASQYLKTATKFNKFFIHDKKRSEDKKQKRAEKRRLKFAQKIKDPSLVLNQHFQMQISEIDQNAQGKLKKPTPRQKIKKIPFDHMKEKGRILERQINFQQFIYNRILLISKDDVERQPQSQLLSQPSSHLLERHKSSSQKFLGVKKGMIGRLHSHKVVMGSQIDDQHSVRDDDMFDNLSAHELSISGDYLMSSDLPAQGKGDNIAVTINIVQDDILQPAQLHASPPAKMVRTQTMQQKQTYHHLKEMLIKTFHEQKTPKFDLHFLNKTLQKMGDTQQIQFIRQFVYYLYKQPIQQMNKNLKLIDQIARRHPQAQINAFFLQSYIRIYNTQEKYGLELDLTTILPINSIFIKSKNLMDLFESVQPYIKQKLNDQNVFKLSKLIALGFRKNIVEQEILFDYLKIIMNAYLSLPETELEQQYQKIRSIMHKLTNQLLAQRGQQLFHALYDCDRKKTLVERYVQSLSSKGYPTAARQLTEKLLPS